MQQPTQTPHRTPLRRVSQGSLFRLSRSNAYPDAPHGLGFLEPAMSEFLDETETLHANLDGMRRLSDSLTTFNESFASWLYIMNMNALTTDWGQAPTEASFALAKRRAERDAVAAMEALQSRNAAKAREIQIANSVADKTTVTDSDMTFAGNTTTAAGTSTQKSGIPAKKKGVKPKLSAKEKKQRSAEIEKIVACLPLEFRGSDPTLRKHMETVIEGVMYAPDAVKLLDLVSAPDLNQARVNKCLVTLVNRKVVQKAAAPKFAILDERGGAFSVALIVGACLSAPGEILWREAYSSASSSSDEEEEITVSPNTPEKPPSRAPSNVEDEHLSESESSSSSSSSEMQEDELIPSPSPRARKPKSNALVQDENGDLRFAHEVHVRVSPASSSSPLSSPPRTNATNRGDPTIIPWAQQVGVDAQKMHVMQTALFRMPEEAAALKAMNEPTKTPGLVLDKFVNRKHSRDSDGDGLRVDSRERASFGQDVEPQMFKPTRKYARVGITSSIANDNEGAYIDAGLAMGRSFRVGWGPGGQLVHLGVICSPSTTTTTSANSSTVTLTKILAALAPSKADTGNPSSPELASKLLQHHLSHTTISRDESNIPAAFPTSSASTSTTAGNIFSDTPASSSYPLNFSSFAALFPSTDISSPAPIFRLGSALFDPIALHLGRSKPGVTNRSNITPEIRNRVNVLRRKTALSKWLENDVKSIVDGELRIQSSGSNGTYTPADAAFTQLTGHQVSQACSTTAEGGYLKLATLISQAGGDTIYKDDIRAQLEIWKSEKLAPGSNPNPQTGLVGRGVWRVYSLLCGLDMDGTNRPEDDLFSGLDWKRVFGLCLWYGTTVDASVADAVSAYERILLNNSKGPSSEIARPIPKWTSTSGKKGSQLPPVAGPGLGLYLGSSPRHAKDGLPDDPLYALIKLHADPALSLTSALNPRSFGPSGLDWGIGMCWHFYVILSRVMRVRDFADRGDPGVVRPRKTSTPRGRPSLANGRSRSGASTDSRDDDDTESDIQVEGHSPTADLLASSYAFELESWGMVQEAAFVLLHLEGSVGREKALKDLLARSGPKLDDWMTRALVGSLKLPMTWVDEAKAMHEYDSGRFFSAYELYLSAHLYTTAHTLALLELAPDAIIRKDLELLRSLFSPFDSDGKRDKVDGWFVRGKVILNYVDTMTKLPKLLDEVAAENEDGETVPDAVQSEHIDALAKGIPRIIALLPDILHRSRVVDARHVAALEEMTKDLLKLEERARPLLLSQIHQSTLGVLDGATKINLIRGLGYARFLQSVGA